MGCLFALFVGCFACDLGVLCIAVMSCGCVMVVLLFVGLSVGVSF